MSEIRLYFVTFIVCSNTISLKSALSSQISTHFRLKTKSQHEFNTNIVKLKDNHQTF
jgi:hypothetical protein